MNTVAAARALDERAAEPSGIRSLLRILLPSATLLLGLFELPAYITVLHGPVAYPVGVAR